MAIGLLGRKVGMTQIFDDSGNVVPVTVIEAGPCHVLQLRTKERDGYEAVQVGFLDKPRRLASRSERGHVAKLDSKRAKGRAKAGVEPAAKADCEPQRFVREFRVAVEGVTPSARSSTSTSSPKSSGWTSPAPARAAARPASWCGTTWPASGLRTA